MLRRLREEFFRDRDTQECKTRVLSEGSTKLCLARGQDEIGSDAPSFHSLT